MDNTWQIIAVVTLVSVGIYLLYRYVQRNPDADFDLSWPRRRDDDDDDHDDWD